MRRVRVTITLEPETFTEVELQRGMMPRSYYIEELIINALEEKEKKEDDYVGYQ